MWGGWETQMGGPPFNQNTDVYHKILWLSVQAQNSGAIYLDRNLSATQLIWMHSSPPQTWKETEWTRVQTGGLGFFLFFFLSPPSLVIWFRIKQKVCMAFQFGWTLLSVHFALTGFLQGQAQFLCYRVRELRLCVNYMLLLVISPPGLSLVHQGKLVSQVRRSFFMLWIITKECQHC